ncbi:MAG: single-stranded DNA-binding protein [Candidatus Muirbacterium halophilum]|nr:single-stranded DNA-binding protein [Candidatus Muirbacterium halophilum]MCK9474714.1 single-stranded DNA-binding protein [Candidatus Muirbacterium halophilum]
MSDINKVILIGRLTRDPEIRYTNSGTPVVTISLAVNRKTSSDNAVDFIDIVLWKKLAELSNKYLKKGSQIAVDGRLQVRTYESDSGKRKVYEVVASSLQFLDKVNKIEKENSLDSGQKFSDDINNDTEFFNNFSDNDEIPF